jgi:hypothetical protein
MSVNPGTLRGTPNRGQGRGAIPFANTPTQSGIPRPVLENAPATTSEAGASSTVSASRQKQSKRDEVRFYPHRHHRPPLSAVLDRLGSQH